MSTPSELRAKERDLLRMAGEESDRPAADAYRVLARAYEALAQRNETIDATQQAERSRARWLVRQAMRLNQAGSDRSAAAPGSAARQRRRSASPGGRGEERG